MKSSKLGYFEHENSSRIGPWFPVNALTNSESVANANVVSQGCRIVPTNLRPRKIRDDSRMGQVVDDYGGVVNNYIGDAIMALFGALLEMSDQASHALDASLEMREALAGLNQELFSGNDYSLRFGIGIHTATVVAGNIGSPQRYNYTVIGDGVNVASRLQTLTRKAEYGADIIISEATLLESAGQFKTRRLGEVAVKGKQQLVIIHALLGRAASSTGGARS